MKKNKLSKNMPYSLNSLYDDVAQVQHTNHDLFGSGRLIGTNLVLTARHVLTPEGAESPVPNGWQVRLIADRREAEKWNWIDASVTWVGQGSLDLALLKLHMKESTLVRVPKLRLRIARIAAVEHHPVRALGFPRGAKVNSKRILLVPSGELDDEGGPTLSFGIDQSYQPESPGEDWRGSSGGAVVLAESPDPSAVWIYGVVRNVPEAFTRRLAVTRLAEAWEDNAFREALGSPERPADPLVWHEIVTQPGLVLYDSKKAQALSIERISMARAWLCALPEITGRLIGGDEDLIHLKRIILGARDAPQPPSVVCISGKPGVGKSTLMLRLAHAIKDQFSDGVLYINLHGLDGNFVEPISAFRLFLSAIKQATQDELTDLVTASRAYHTELKNRAILVVLDDARDAEQARPLVASGLRCATIVTSRRVLSTVANPSEALVRLETLDANQAINFIRSLVSADRADKESFAIGELVQLCGCLPLALSIAAGRLRSRPDWPISHLTALLRDEQNRLAHLEVDDLAVRSCIALSYLDLDPQTQRLFRVASLVPGLDFTAPVIAAMVNEPRGKILILLNQLVDRSLLEARTLPDPQTAGYIDRFSFHSLILLYAREEFSSHAETQRSEFETRLASYYAEIAEGTYTFPDWFEFERANLLAVARMEFERKRWAALRKIRTGMQKRLALSVHLSDLEEVFRCERSVLSELHLASEEAEVIEQFAALLGQQPDRLSEAASLWVEAEQAWSAIGDIKAVARCSFELSCMFGRQKSWPDAIRNSERALERFEKLGDLAASGVVTANLLAFTLRTFDESALERYLTSAEQLVTKLESEEVKARLLFYLGYAHRRLNHARQAVSYFKSLADLDAKNGIWTNEAIDCRWCASILSDANSKEEAISYLERSIVASRKAQTHAKTSDDFTEIGRLHALAGRWEEAFKAHAESLAALPVDQEADFPRRATCSINKAVVGVAVDHPDSLKDLKEAISLAESCKRQDLVHLAMEAQRRLSELSNVAPRLRAQEMSLSPLREEFPDDEFWFVQQLPRCQAPREPGLLS